MSKCGKNFSDTLGYRFVCHFFCSYHIICDILLNRRTATWNLFVKQKAMIHAHVIRIPKNQIKLKKKNKKKEKKQQNIYDRYQLHAIMNVHE